MRINDVKYGLYTYQNQVNRNKTNSTKTVSQDTVTISSKGQEILQASKSDQVDRQAKIQALKQQIQNGTPWLTLQKVH